MNIQQKELATYVLCIAILVVLAIIGYILGVIYIFCWPLFVVLAIAGGLTISIGAIVWAIETLEGY